MPAQKRSPETTGDPPENYNDDSDGDDEEEEEEEQEEEEEKQGRGGDSDRSTSSDDDDNDKEEFIVVRLSDIRKEVQCPICLGIIRKTRTVMECLHRFCRECIDKSMRMGNNECPACRTHCASRRSLRDDPNYDSLIAALYLDIDRYEEDELAFQEDDKARNKQIQTAIAQTFQRQSEALTRKRRRSQSNHRKRRNYQSEDEDEVKGHDGIIDGKNSSSADERCTEVRPKRSKRWRGQPSPAHISGDGGGNENDQEAHREPGLSPAVLVGSSEMLAWGKGGIRSHTRYGGGSGGNSKQTRSRVARLVDHLRNLDESDNEMDIHVVLIPLDEQKAPLLQHSYLCVSPALSVRQLCQIIALQTSLPVEEIEILAAKGLVSKLNSLRPVEVEESSSNVFESCKDDLKVLESEQTLAAVKSAYHFTHGCLMLAYKQKLSA